MQPAKIYTAAINARGQLTIPKKIRDQKHLDDGQTVSLIPLGEAVLIAPIVWSSTKHVAVSAGSCGRPG